MSKISFISLGCDKNLVDSEVMIGILKEAGHTITGDETEAEIIVVNTCCFIEDALKESIDTIIELGETKGSNLRTIIAAGCLTERYKCEIFKELPEIDIILGATSYERIAEAVDAAINGRVREFFSDISQNCDENLSLKRELSTPGSHFAYLKIAEGCDNHCTYCVIPSLRGRYRSRTIESLVKEAEMLAEKGVKELVIVAQDTSRYGEDIYKKNMLPTLLHKLSLIEDIEWIRLMYCYPENIGDELIEEIKSNKKICKYIDMPIQHISNNILKLMGRRTNSENIKGIINKLREKIDGIVIRTSLITGFPGETEQDFEELLQFVEDYKIDRLGVFPFSKEEGTPAFRMKGQIKKTVKVKRKNALMKAQKEVMKQKQKDLVGKSLRVLVEGKIAGEDAYICRSYMDAPSVDSYVFVNREDDLLSGDFIETTVEGFYEYDLLGS